MTDPRTVIRDKVAEALRLNLNRQAWIDRNEPSKHRDWINEFQAADAAIAAHLEALEQAAHIETVEQLDALPEDSVVRDDSRYVYEKATSRRWHQPGWEGHRWSVEIDLPARVLWRPEGA